jgi:hypothetical protein
MSRLGLRSVGSLSFLGVTWGNTVVRRGAARRHRSTVAGLALLAAALILLAVPAFAAAVGFEVNGVGDGANKTECETPSAGDECTLRGAIEAANASTGFSLIEFPSAPFDGQVGIDEIGPGASPLPAITQPVTMFGHPCEYPLLGFNAPCVEVKGRIGQAVLKVESDDVTIEEVAFGGGKSGIEVAASADKFTSRSDWFGLQLDAAADPIEAAGIVVGTASDEATIGGTAESERNVFAHAETGVELKGASKARILGNYIGVGPDGHGATGLETGVRVEDFAAPAEEDEIGGPLGSAGIAAKECLGPCNAIATEGGAAIDLAGSASDPQPAAHGPTLVAGNYIGLEPDGTGTVGENAYGVLAAPSAAGCADGPADVSVGGVAPGSGNFIAGGIFGIAAESAENFRVLGNAIGVAPGGSAVESPQVAAISLCAESVTEPALVTGNRMILEPDTVGVESFFGHAEIVGNSIRGGLFGIETREAGVGGGDIINVNKISGTDRQGILIADDFNVVIGNSITDAAWAGITIEEGGEHNRIGGDEAGEANTINASGLGNPAGAIQIEGEESSRNEVAANTGAGNIGAFIELMGPGSEIPNGLKPPTLTAAFQSSATGTAAPNTVVRVFSKASSAPGELGALLAVASADGVGGWTATYASQPVGTLVAATQTIDAGGAAAGTSEVSAPLAAVVDPPMPPEPEQKGGGGDTTQPPATSSPPAKVPKVKITSGPKKSSKATTAKFKFKADPSAGAKFECKLDDAKWARCNPPRTYKKLKPGRHTFRVKAKASGLAGAVAKYQFTVKS